MTAQVHLIGYVEDPDGWPAMPGATPTRPVNVRIEDRNGELTFSQSARGEMPKFVGFAGKWDQKRATKLWDLAKRWHLNHLLPWCPHQRVLIEERADGWDPDLKVTLHSYTWADGHYEQRRKAGNGTLSIRKYAEYKKEAALVRAAMFGGSATPKWSGHPAIQEALDKGLIKPKDDKKETKPANQVSHRSHPDGLISKPCPECGYKYGSEWLKETVPDNVITWLNFMLR